MGLMALDKIVADEFPKWDPWSRAVMIYQMLDVQKDQLEDFLMTFPEPHRTTLAKFAKKHLEENPEATIRPNRFFSAIWAIGCFTLAILIFFKFSGLWTYVVGGLLLILTLGLLSSAKEVKKCAGTGGGSKGNKVSELKTRLLEHVNSPGEKDAWKTREKASKNLRNSKILAGMSTLGIGLMVLKDCNMRIDIKKYGGSILYQYDGKDLKEYGGSILFQYDGKDLRKYGGSILFQYDGKCLKKYGGGTLLETSSSVPIPVLIACLNHMGIL